MMQMMNNPMITVMSMLRAGKSPNTILRNMATNDPQVRQLMQMMQGKTPDQLQKMARNMAAERGTTVEDIAKQLGIQIPSNR